MRHRLELVAGLLLMVSAVAHGASAQSHVQAFGDVGLLFVVSLGAQAVIGLALLTDAFEERKGRAGWLRPKRALLLAGGCFNLVASAVQAVLFGVAPADASSALDIVTTVAAAVAGVLLLQAWRLTWTVPHAAAHA